MRSFAVYYRVSTDKQELDSQKLAVESFLQNLPPDKKPDKVTTFIDDGLSGSNQNRPAYQALILAAVTKEVDTIVCYKLDRLSRHANSAIKLLLELDELGCAFISVSQPVLNLGHENPFRRTMLAAFAEIAEIERQTIVDRVKAGLEAARKRGVRLGPPPTIPDFKRVAALELRREGLSYNAIAKKLRISVGLTFKMCRHVVVKTEEGLLVPTRPPNS